MATSPSAYDPTFDVAVPSDDVVIGGQVPAGAQAALEIAGRAAWLAWQIDAKQIDAQEALRQLVAIVDDLARFGSAFPRELRERVSTALESAHGAAATGNLEVAGQAAKDMRETLEQYHNDMLV